MSYTLLKNVGFGSSKTGLSTVTLQLLNADGTPNGGTIGGVDVIETAGGYYQSVVTIPDAFVGAIEWDSGDGSPRIVVDEINPGDCERIDTNVASRSTATNVSDGTAAVIAALPDDPDNAGITAIQAKTDNLPAAPSEFDASTDKVTPVDADGVTYAKAMQALLAVCLGKASISGSAVSFKARDGTTEVVNVTVGATVGQRTASTIT